AAPATNQQVLAVAAQQDVVASAALEAVIAAVAVQPGGQADAAGNLDVVVAGLPEGDQPAGGGEDALGHAVDGDLHCTGAAHRTEDDAVVARAATHSEHRLRRVGRIDLQLHGVNGQRLAGGAHAAGVVGHGEGDRVAAGRSRREAEAHTGARADQSVV